MGHGICQMLANLAPRLPAEDLLARMGLPCLQFLNFYGPVDHLRKSPCRSYRPSTLNGYPSDLVPLSIDSTCDGLSKPSKSATCNWLSDRSFLCRCCPSPRGPPHPFHLPPLSLSPSPPRSHLHFSALSITLSFSTRAASTYRCHRTRDLQITTSLHSSPRTRHASPHYSRTPPLPPHHRQPPHGAREVSTSSRALSSVSLSHPTSSVISVILPVSKSIVSSHFCVCTSDLFHCPPFVMVQSVQVARSVFRGRWRRAVQSQLRLDYVT